jgi:hypothetical protein
MPIGIQIFQLFLASTGPWTTSRSGGGADLGSFIEKCAIMLYGDLNKEHIFGITVQAIAYY